ncbi:MAG: hypothetical protein RM022_030265 [Nostoc sp. EfeVER01]|nr:hypothetical protein [Nostoc sp. EfeVER01]MDZ7946023.1 hypothetical protein [Nostoc sp. EfeVER01]
MTEEQGSSTSLREASLSETLTRTPTATLSDRGAGEQHFGYAQ